MDTTPPSTTSSVTGLFDDAGIKTGNVASGTTTDDTSLVVSGTLGGDTAGATLASGETLRVYDGATYLGNATVTVTSGGQSTWSYSDTRTLTDAQALSYTVKVADAAGNEYASGTAYTATVDTTPPSTPGIDRVADDDIINLLETGSTITGTCESAATVTLSIGGTTRTPTVTDTTWSYTLVDADITNMGQGAETLSVTQADAAGNTSTVTRDIWVDTLDTTPPTTTSSVNGLYDDVGIFQGNVDSGKTTDDTSLVVSGTLGGVSAGASLDVGETLRVYDGATYLGNAVVTVTSGGQSTWSYSDTRTLTDAQALSYTVKVADAAGN